MTTNEAVVLYVDGGCLGKNPSEIGVYFSVGREYPDGRMLPIHSKTTNFERYTNNEAEWLAINAGLEYAATLAPSRVVLHSDSQLIVNQFNRKWGCYDDKLVPLRDAAERAKDFLASAGFELEVKWVGRAANVQRLGH